MTSDIGTQFLIGLSPFSISSGATLLFALHILPRPCVRRFCLFLCHDSQLILLARSFVPRTQEARELNGGWLGGPVTVHGQRSVWNAALLTSSTAAKLTACTLLTGNPTRHCTASSAEKGRWRRGAPCNVHERTRKQNRSANEMKRKECECCFLRFILAMRRRH